MTQNFYSNSRRNFFSGALASLIALTGVQAFAKRTTISSIPAKSARGYATWSHGLVHFYDNFNSLPDKGSILGNPLVLLHQAPQSARQFESIYAPLANRSIRAIGIDIPGFGLSDPTPFVPNIDDWVPAVIAVLNHLDIDSCDVLGHHTGALIATELALRNPDRVRNIILNGAFPINDEERQVGLESVRRREINFEYKADGSHFIQTFMNRYNLYGSGADPKLITRIVVEKFQGFGPFWYGHAAAYRYDHASSLQRLRHKTLLLTNTGDQIYKLTSRAHVLRPDFSYVELQGGGVDIVDQQSQQWCDAVVKFINS